MARPGDAARGAGNLGRTAVEYWKNFPNDSPGLSAPLNLCFLQWTDPQLFVKLSRLKKGAGSAGLFWGASKEETT